MRKRGYANIVVASSILLFQAHQIVRIQRNSPACFLQLTSCTFSLMTVVAVENVTCRSSSSDDRRFEFPDTRGPLFNTTSFLVLHVHTTSAVMNAPLFQCHL
ncbi:hypothetical protein BO86DRAFT_81785 [Aspergillus japonicus CBS 114.51]|uniref:Uncharacterized protein n=1 Tax=Aspergillus japonicus CBS 114.51 TaxID=1448312 RepID=A0A8T8X2G0_ASPJA|nr:hypothetical protein BO86DRAFT_81785 [Aspergillus japonicus CBS 114.51]RAH82337.1 hypothetical protein BO86DRAFT_81785 [Aspergillus japonicus CBS 114.51]